jgi:hypothetical protein
LAALGPDRCAGCCGWLRAMRRLRGACRTGTRIHGGRRPTTSIRRSLRPTTDARSPRCDKRARVRDAGGPGQRAKRGLRGQQRVPIPGVPRDRGARRRLGGGALGHPFTTAPSGPWDVLKYGFLGSYAFVTSMLIRRFFQSDLRPSAYASSVFRIMLLLLIVAVLHQLIAGASPVISHAVSLPTARSRHPLPRQMPPGGALTPQIGAHSRTR